MKPGEIHLAMFPFGNTPGGMKLRPVLILSQVVGPVPEVIVAYISSVVPAQVIESDIELDPSDQKFQCTHLKVRSVLRLHKVATIHRTSIVRKIGTMPSAIEPLVKIKLRSILNLT